MADALLCMAYHETGKKSEAKALLEDVEKRIAGDESVEAEYRFPAAGDQKLNKAWHDLLICRILHREARALLSPKND